ncbi:MAG: ATP synthase F0 subunit A [Planctomycetota bacterium]|nr:MAG: ATP synthase F0 subunit A [Planctomycetota bacterium]
MLRLAAENWIAHHLIGIDEVAGLRLIGVSKPVVAMFLVVALLLLTFLPFGRRVRRDVAPRGVLVNLLEVILLFLRDEVTRPILGKEGDKYLPVVWTFFFFILYCNLLGLIPTPLPVPLVDAHTGTVEWSLLGGVTATGQFLVTMTLALIAFVWWHGLGIYEQGLIAYLRHICPGGVPGFLKLPLWAIEFVLHFVKAGALMIRLWANMTGGHAVLYAMIGLIFIFGTYWIAPVSVAAGVAVFMLEIFVAFLQAFVFTFLVVVFLGDALHPH